MLGRPKRCKLAHACLWKCSYEGMKLAQLLGRLSHFGGLDHRLQHRLIVRKPQPPGVESWAVDARHSRVNFSGHSQSILAFRKRWLSLSQGNRWVGSWKVCKFNGRGLEIARPSGAILTKIVHGCQIATMYKCPNCEAWPSILIENPYQSRKAGPQSGPTLCNFR